MSSLMTNNAAMTALQTLRSVNAGLATTQNRISTGYRVSTASDNAAYWSIATTMRSDVQALSAVQDALGLGAATIDTMYTGLNGTVSVVSQIKAKLVAARTPGVDRAKIQSEITELQKQLKNTADSAVFNGENWISVDSTSASYNATKSVVSSFSRVGGSVKIDTLSVNLDAIKLYDANLDTAYNAQAFPTASTAAYAVATDVGGNITVTVGTAPAINIAVAAKTSLSDIATQINKLNIEGLSVGVNTAGTMLSFKSRNDADIVINAAVAGLGGAVTLTALAAPVDSKKGVLDQTFDAFTGAAWETVSVAKLDISKITDNASDLAKLETYIQGVEDAFAKITDSATNLGAIKNRIGLQQDFVKTLTDSLDRGIGQLVDADMNAESTRLQALQVQQQLGIQALSIANSGSQSILSLFRG
ncbi:MAG: flagellin [Bradyrhizobium sp.]|nr:flagellin [Bradyrhizobium sp.]